MGGVDLSLFRWMNDWPDSLAPLMKTLSTANGTLWFKIVVLAIVVAMVWRGGMARRSAILALVAFPLTDFLCNTCKHLWPMHRPFQELDGVHVWVGKTDSMGTASSHAGNLAAVATVMTLGLGIRWGAPWIVLAIMVGFSRVYVGVHYPSQVLFGWTIGVLVGFAADRAVRAFVARRMGGVTDDPTPTPTQREGNPAN